MKNCDLIGLNPFFKYLTSTSSSLNYSGTQHKDIMITLLSVSQSVSQSVSVCVYLTLDGSEARSEGGGGAY